jgi:hypothetical protein
VQIDGESAGQLPCEISLSPYPVRLMVPRAYAEQYNGRQNGNRVAQRASLLQISDG